MWARPLKHSLGICTNWVIRDEQMKDRSVIGLLQWLHMKAELDLWLGIQMAQQTELVESQLKRNP